MTWLQLGFGALLVCVVFIKQLNNDRIKVANNHNNCERYKDLVAIFSHHKRLELYVDRLKAEL